MASETSIWYKIGHAVERARHVVPAPVDDGRGDAAAELENPREGRNGARAPGRPAIPSSDELMTAGVALVVDRLLDGWGRARRPGVRGLVRAAVAGAVAAFLTEMVRPLLRADAGLPALDRGTAERVLAGVGQGLVYGGVVEPRLPGPALLKGAVFGSVEYAVHPLGGLSGVLGSHTPQRRVPFLGDVLDDLDGEERAYLEHLVFGIALALIYESSPESNGILPEEV